MEPGITLKGLSLYQQWQLTIIIQRLRTTNIEDAELAFKSAGVGSFKYVPVIFFGSHRFDFEGVRSAAAFTPCLAKCQPVGSKIYFPEPFGVFDKNGTDLFKQYVTGLLPSASFLDYWDIYHVNPGEVHCGQTCRDSLVGMVEEIKIKQC